MSNRSSRRSLELGLALAGLLVLLQAGAPALAAAGTSGAPPEPSRAATWPTYAEQLLADNVQHGTALEQLISENQDFSILDPGEMHDSLGIPLWLRVNWRKAHPELKYSPADPTHGYPLVLHEAHEWMVTHQNFEATVSQLDDDSVDYDASTGANVRLSGAQSAARSESDIRVNYWDPSKIIGASNNISSSGQQAQFYSTDSGQTWGQTYLPLQSGDAFMSDPTVDWTSDGTAWSTTIGINSSATVLKMRAYKSTNNGATWTFDATFSGSQSSADKQMIWTDHSATSTYHDNIYAIYHNGTPVYLSRHTGGSWSSPVRLSGSETTGTGIGADVKTNASGDVFAFWPDTGSKRIFVSKSTNGGSSWSSPTIIASTYGSFQIGVPSFNSRKLLIYTASGAYRNGSTNNVYTVWADLSGESGCTSPSNEPGSNVNSSCKTRIWFSRSTDGGSTWSSKVRLNHQSSLNDQFNPWLVVDETTGKIAVMYYDTVGDSGRKKVDVWYQSSSDNGATWTSPLKVTTAMTDETISGADSGNQFGDYNSLSGIAGNFFPSWTDRRSGGHEEIWSAKVVDGGGGGCTPPAAPTGVSASASSQTAVNVSWSATSGATSYTVFRSATSGGPYSSIGTTSSTSLGDSGLTCNTSYYYVVTASNGTCDSGNSAQASATTQACSGGSTATYDSTLKAPKCGTVGNTCDSGAALVLGRASLGPEPNQPNTINNSCADGTSGSFHSDESNDRVKVSTVDGTDFAPGKQVRVEATVWAWSGYTSDHLDLYYAADATSPSWTLIASVDPTAAGSQVLSATYTLPSGGSLQAVRAAFRYQGSAGSCASGSYNDRDDLIFAVGGGGGDTTPPSTSITAPSNGATVSGTVNVTASASDNVGVTSVDFYIDGGLAGTDTTSPYSYSWNTASVANGSHSIFSRAHDAAGNVGTSSTVNVTVNNTVPDTTPPTTSITAPSNGSTVSGTVAVTASASDNVGVTSVAFYIDGGLASTDTTSPYSYSWDTTAVANGSHSIFSRAYDAAGNVGTSSTVNVTVNNSTGGCTDSTLYSNNFESGSGMSNWTKGTFVSGGSTTDWRGIQTCSAASGSKIFRFGGTGCTSNYTSNDFTFAVPNGATGISVPAGSSGASLTFKHRRRFESGYDGGAIAVSLDGSNYTWVGASSLSGASYNGTIAAYCAPSGAAGTAVFTGASTSFSTTTVDLDAVCNAITGGSGGCAGQTVYVAFASISDCSVTDDGWFLDDVQVSACTP